MIDINVGDKVKFENVEKLVGNDFFQIEENKWYEVVRVRKDLSNGFELKTKGNVGFYVSSEEHRFIKKIKKDKNKKEIKKLLKSIRCLMNEEDKEEVKKLYHKCFESICKISDRKKAEECINELLEEELDV